MEIQLFISGVPPKQTVDISEGKFLASILLLISHKISFNFIQKQKRYKSQLSVSKQKKK